MYPVSDAFLLAVKQNTRKYYWTGRITAKSGAVITPMFHRQLADGSYEEVRPPFEMGVANLINSLIRDRIITTKSMLAFRL